MNVSIYSKLKNTNSWQYYGNLFTAIQHQYVNPCQPSPCGPNSQCREINEQGVCSCLPNFIGTPPGCRPECVSSSECSNDRACINQKCSDPCPGVCGTNSNCRVNNHSPICSCRLGYTGDPFTRCNPIPRKLKLFFVRTQSNFRFWLKFAFSSNWSYRSWWNKRSMLSLSMWTKRWVSKYKRCSILFVSKYIYRTTTKLSSWMHNKFWMSEQQSLYTWKMYWSLSRIMWYFSFMFGSKSYSKLSMYWWIYWWSFYQMSTTTSSS